MKRKRVLFWMVTAISGLFFLPMTTMAQDQLPGLQTGEDYMRAIRANQLTGQIDPQDVLTARLQSSQLHKMKNGNALDLNWMEMGPDNVASRTRVLLIDRSNPAIMYIGAVTGGIWKSTSGGSSWTQTLVRNTTDSVLNVTCMAQAPDGTLYAGTGEGFLSGNGTGNGGIVGTGLYKSTDGLHFNLIPGTQPVANSTTANWAYINSLAVSSAGRVFVAYNKGLKYSEDNGATWTYAQSGGSDITENAMEVVVSADGMVIANAGGKFLISENGDPNAFVNRSIGGAGNLPLGTTIGRLKVAVAPSNTSVIYVLAVKTNQALDNVYRSVDKGATWKVIGPGGSANFNVFGTGTSTSSNQYGVYAASIAVFPNNPDKVIVGGVNMWRGTKIDDGYFSWEQASDGLFFPSFYPLYVHTYHHAYAFHPNNPATLFIASDGGISKSDDGAITFQRLNRNYNVTQAYSVEPTYLGQVLMGTQGAGIQIIDFNGNTNKAATELVRGDVGSYAEVSVISPKVIIVSTTAGAFRRSVDNGENFSGFNATAMNNLSGGYITPILLWESFDDPFTKDSVRFISFDTINHNEYFTVKSANGDYPFRVMNTGSTIYPHDTLYVKDQVQAKFFLGANGTVWFTKKALDFGGIPPWFKLTNFTGIVQSMACTKDGDMLFVGMQDGLVLRIKNLTSYVSDTSHNIKVDTLFQSVGRAVTSIAVSPEDNNKTIITLGNYGNSQYVYYSSNALSATPAYTLKQGNLPAMPVYSSVIEMNNANRVIIGTELGIYATDNINATPPQWTTENTGLGNVPVMMLKQTTENHWPLIVDNDSVAISDYGVIYAASHGRGIFRCSKFVGITEPNHPAVTPTAQLHVYPNPAVNEVTIDYYLTSSTHVTIQVLSLTGQLVKEIVIPNKVSGVHSYKMAFGNQLPSGSYILKLNTNTTSKTAKFVVL